MPSESIVVPHEDGAATSEQLACYANAHLSTANNPYLVSVIWWDAQSNFFVDFFGTDKPKTQEMSERESHLGNVCRIRQKEQNSFKPRSVRPSIWPENASCAGSSLHSARLHCPVCVRPRPTQPHAARSSQVPSVADGLFQNVSKPVCVLLRCNGFCAFLGLFCFTISVRGGRGTTLATIIKQHPVAGIGYGLSARIGAAAVP